MKTYIPTLIIVAISLFVVSPILGQSSISPEEKAKKRTDMLRQHLQLSDEQVAQVEEIHLIAAYAIEDLINNSELDNYTKKKLFEKMNKEWENKLKTVFTPEQSQKYLIMSNRKD